MFLLFITYYDTNKTHLPFLLIGNVIAIALSNQKSAVQWDNQHSEEALLVGGKKCSVVFISNKSEKVRRLCCQLFSILLCLHVLVTYIVYMSRFIRSGRTFIGLGNKDLPFLRLFNRGNEVMMMFFIYLKNSYKHRINSRFQQPSLRRLRL